MNKFIIFVRSAKSLQVRKQQQFNADSEVSFAKRFKLGFLKLLPLQAIL